LPCTNSSSKPARSCGRSSGMNCPVCSMTTGHHIFGGRLRGVRDQLTRALSRAHCQNRHFERRLREFIVVTYVLLEAAIQVVTRRLAARPRERTHIHADVSLADCARHNVTIVVPIKSTPGTPAPCPRTGSPRNWGCAAGERTAAAQGFASKGRKESLRPPPIFRLHRGTARRRHKRLCRPVVLNHVCGISAKLTSDGKAR